MVDLQKNGWHIRPLPSETRFQMTEGQMLARLDTYIHSVAFLAPNRGISAKLGAKLHIIHFSHKTPPYIL